MRLDHHYITKPFPVPPNHDEVKVPDYFGAVDNLPVLIAEVKKPGDPESSLLRDRRKLACLMKLSLNMMLNERVSNPTVVGLLFQDNVCEVQAMELRHEAKEAWALRSANDSWRDCKSDRSNAYLRGST
ncbi:hypothetical protein BGX31_004093, partial [Mortierella sp. GBA43]